MSSTRRRSAADWFVELDARRGGPDTEARFNDWLAEADGRDEELGRCEAAVQLTRSLAADPALRWMFDDAAHLARARPTPARLLAWLRKPALAWSVAGLSLLVAVGAVIERNVLQPRPSAGTESWRAAAAVPYEVTSELAMSDPTVVLPGHVVVDARSLAVLPFRVVADDARGRGAQRARTVAAALYDAVRRRLASIPGIYVAEPESAAAYANVDIVPGEMAAQLGVRGIVDGSVTSADGHIRVLLRLTDAAKGVMWQSTFDRPLDATAGMETDMAIDIAAALANAREPGSGLSVDGETR